MLQNLGANLNSECLPNHAANYGFTNNIGNVYVFAPGQDMLIRGVYPVDVAISSTAQVAFFWTVGRPSGEGAIPTTGNLRWQLAYYVVRGSGVGLDINILTQQTETVTGTIAAPSTAKNSIRTVVNLTAANIQKGDLLIWGLRRNGTHGQDTCTTGYGLVLDVVFDNGA